MMIVKNLIYELKMERDRVQKQLRRLNAAISAFADVYTGTTPTRKRTTLSAKAKEKIAAAQRARWAKVKAQKKVA